MYNEKEYVPDLDSGAISLIIPLNLINLLFLFFFLLDFNLYPESNKKRKEKEMEKKIVIFLLVPPYPVLELFLHSARKD